MTLDSPTVGSKEGVVSHERGTPVLAAEFPKGVYGFMR